MSLSSDTSQDRSMVRTKFIPPKPASSSKTASRQARSSKLSNVDTDSIAVNTDAEVLDETHDNSNGSIVYQSSASKLDFQQKEGHIRLGPLPKELIDEIEYNCEKFGTELPSCARQKRDPSNKSGGKTLLDLSGLPTPFVLKDTTEGLLAGRYVSEAYLKEIIVVQQKPESTTIPRLNNGKPVIIWAPKQVAGRTRWYIWDPDLKKFDKGNDSAQYVEKIKAGTEESKDFESEIADEEEEELMPLGTAGVIDESLSIQVEDNESEATRLTKSFSSQNYESTSIDEGTNLAEPQHDQSGNPLRRSGRSTRKDTTDTIASTASPSVSSSHRQSTPGNIPSVRASKAVSRAKPPPLVTSLIQQMSSPNNSPLPNTSRSSVATSRTDLIQPSTNTARFLFPSSREGHPPDRIPVSDVSSVLELFELAFLSNIISDKAMTIKVVFHDDEYVFHKKLPEMFKAMVLNIVESGKGGDISVMRAV